MIAVRTVHDAKMSMLRMHGSVAHERQSPTLSRYNLLATAGGGMKLGGSNWWQPQLAAQWHSTLTSGMAALLVAGSALTPMPMQAMTDNVEIGKCVVSQCTVPLAKCVATSPTCLANLICIQTCVGQPDESECQIRCGDKFTDDKVAEFTKCAVSDRQVSARTRRTLTC